MTREQAGEFIDGLDDEALTRLIAELMWFQVTHRALDNGPTRLADLQRLMAAAAREHVVDVLTGESVTPVVQRGNA